MSIGLTDWLLAIGFLSFGLFFISFVISLTTMFIIGPSKYLKQLRCLWRFKIDKSFIKSHVFKTNFTKILEEDYYFFIDVISDNEIIVVKCLSPYLSFWEIQIIKKIDNEWADEEFKMSISACLLSQLLNGLITRKMRKESLNSTRIENTSTINDFLNTEVIQLSRDRKLKEILK